MSGTEEPQGQSLNDNLSVPVPDKETLGEAEHVQTNEHGCELSENVIGKRIQTDSLEHNACAPLEIEPQQKVASPEKPKSTPSKVVVNVTTESLRNIMAYEQSSDSENSDSSEEEQSWRQPQKEDSDDSNDSDSDSTTSASSSFSESDSEQSNSDSVIDMTEDRTKNPISKENTNDKGAVKKTNKVWLDGSDFFPPVPDFSRLTIHPLTEFMQIGKINAIVADIVTVQSRQGTPAFDADTMLFIASETDHEKRPLGLIYDIIGPVNEPIYCVRYNTSQEIEALKVKTGMQVFAAPKSEEFSKYVFLRELMKIKGSDASWLNDREQPPEMAEFSDDEDERRARRTAKLVGKRKLEDSSLERHRRYERTMNKCNTFNTRVCRFMDTRKPLPDFPVQSGRIPPDFNPRVPPPGFKPYVYRQPRELPTAPSLMELNNSLTKPGVSADDLFNAQNAHVRSTNPWEMMLNMGLPPFLQDASNPPGHGSMNVFRGAGPSSSNHF